MEVSFPSFLAMYEAFVFLPSLSCIQLLFALYSSFPFRITASRVIHIIRCIDFFKTEHMLIMLKP
jgi:hypothetical protein